jgi:hypothetical protein
MPTGSKQRQYYYRLNHPQLNVTFRNADEDWDVRQALNRSSLTPRQVLLNWARQVLTQSQSQEGVSKQNATPVAGAC